MIRLSEATSIAGLATIAILCAGVSISYRLVGTPRRTAKGCPQTLAAESGMSATVGGWKRRVPRSFIRGRALVMVLFIAVGVIAVGPFPALLLLASSFSVGRAMPLFRRRRHRLAIERDLPGTVDLLVLSVHAGLTPDQAVRELAHTAHAATRAAFAEVAHRMDLGEPLADALSALPQQLGPNAAGLAEVVGSASRYGTPLTQVLEQLSGEARSSRRRLDEAAARRLPVRLSFPLVVCTLPSFVLLTIAPAVIAALSSLGVSAG